VIINKFNPKNAFDKKQAGIWAEKALQQLLSENL